MKLKLSKRHLLLVPLSLILIIAVYQIANYAIQTKNAENDVQEAIELANAPKPIPTASVPEPPSESLTEPPEDVPKEIIPDDVQAMLDIDLAALQTENPDVLGWIYIPGTTISYPILQGDTNQTYLRTAWNGGHSVAGCIFMDAKNSPDFTDFNTILYGHHMKNGTMFAELVNYLDETKAAAMPYIYIRTDTQVFVYRVFHAYKTGKTNITYYIDTANETPDEWLAACDEQAGVTLESGHGDDIDSVLTLSTCEGSARDKRAVVQSVLDAVYWTPESAN